jgi:diaminopimelate decarboxylase
MKALSNVAVLQLLKEMGAGLDTVSIQEVQLGLHAGYEPEKKYFIHQMAFL